MPKRSLQGVVVSHHNIVRLVREANYVELTPDDVFLHLAPLAFDASTFEIWGALLNGAKLAVYPVGDAGTHDLLWGYNAGIRSGIATGAGSGMDLYTGATDPVQGVATDGRQVFWVSNGQAIKRGDLSMATTRTTICFTPPQDLGAYADIAVDDQWVYFTWPNKNQIYKCPKN